MKDETFAWEGPEKIKDTPIDQKVADITRVASQEIPDSQETRTLKTPNEASSVVENWDEFSYIGDSNENWEVDWEAEMTEFQQEIPETSMAGFFAITNSGLSEEQTFDQAIKESRAAENTDEFSYTDDLQEDFEFDWDESSVLMNPDESNYIDDLGEDWDVNWGEDIIEEQQEVLEMTRAEFIAIINPAYLTEQEAMDEAIKESRAAMNITESNTEERQEVSETAREEFMKIINPDGLTEQDTLDAAILESIKISIAEVNPENLSNEQAFNAAIIESIKIASAAVNPVDLTEQQAFDAAIAASKETFQEEVDLQKAIEASIAPPSAASYGRFLEPQLTQVMQDNPIANARLTEKDLDRKTAATKTNKRSFK